MKRTLLFLALLLCLCPSARAATYYVSKTGSDANGCSTTDSAGTNKLTIAAGLTCLTAAGDILTIHVGTYLEPINSTAVQSGTGEGTRTIVQGATSETIIIKPNSGNDRGDAVSFGLNKSYITLKNVTVDGSNTIITVSFVSNSHHIRVEGCIIKNSPNNVSVGMRDESASDDKHHLEIVGNTIGPNGSNDFHHGVYLRARDNLIDGNDIFSAKGYGVRFDQPASGIPSSNNIVRNNRIHGHGSRGISLGSGNNNHVYNNLIYSNDTAADSVGGILVGMGNTTNSRVYNNTIWSNKGYCVWIGAGTGHIVINNVCWANTINSILNQTGGNSLSTNLFTDPSFVNTTDFELAVNSTAIGAGTNLASNCPAMLLCTDFNGTARPQGVGWDIGAQERLDAAGDTFTILSPNGGTLGAAGSTQTITWGSTGTAANVRIRYDNDGIGFGSPTVLIASTPNDVGSYSFAAPAAGTTYRFEVCDAADNTPCDYSDADVTITASAGGSFTKILSDNTTGTKIGDITGTDDAYIYSVTPTTNYGSSVSFYAQSDAPSLLRFTGFTGIPSDATVTSVSLSFWLEWADTGTSTVEIKRLLRNFSESQATWNIFSTGNNWTTAGGLGNGTDRVAASSASLSVTATPLGQFYTVTDASCTAGSLCDDVKQRINGTYADLAWHVSTSGTSKRFTSSEGADGQRPALSVSYTVTTASISLTQPTAISHVFPGQLIPVRWTSAGFTGNVVGTLTRNAGASYETIIASHPYDQADAVWPVGGPASEQCKIKVCSVTNPTVCSESPTFKIAGTALFIR